MPKDATCIISATTSMAAFIITNAKAIAAA